MAERHRVNAVAIVGRVHRADGAGVAVVRHGRNFAQVGLVKLGVGKYRADRGVAHKLFACGLQLAQHGFFRVKKSFTTIGQQARRFAASAPVVDVP